MNSTYLSTFFFEKVQQKAKKTIIKDLNMNLGLLNCTFY